MVNLWSPDSEQQHGFYDGGMTGTDSPSEVGYFFVSDQDASRAARTWWDTHADEYLHEHGDFLTDHGFVWGPEGLTESQAQLLGPPQSLAGQRILEIGAGGAQCSAWLVAQGAQVCATDVAVHMLASGQPVPSRVCADALALPFHDESFDQVFTSFGALPFVSDARGVHREVHRVLRPGGHWTFSVTHPARWMFPDDPTEHGMTITRSYFAREPYVERDAQGQVAYVEFHRTLADHINDVIAAGFHLDTVVEPQWQAHNNQVWGGWGPVRGALLPGTLIIRAKRPGRPASPPDASTTDARS